MSINEIAQSYEGGDIVPIYTSEQLEKVGTGETAYVAETGKIYTFEDDKSYLFYGQSEDLTKILNDLIDKRLTSGTKTLLWEMQTTNNYSTVENEINIEDLSKYRQLYVEGTNGSVIYYNYINIKDLQENTGVYLGIGADYIPMVKYTSENKVTIRYYSAGITYKLYGIE